LTAAGADRRLCLKAEKSQSQNTSNAESSPLGEDVQRTEEIPSSQCMLYWVVIMDKITVLGAG